MEFDYVVVGAGSAGCALAARLSESGKYTVALLEAGPKDRNPWIHIPVGYFKTMGNPNADWCYRTAPDEGLNGRSIPYPRGRVLGGSSSINGLLYVRGQPQDYDTWAQMGNRGWAWEDVKPYFERAEAWKGEPKGEGRGRRGPLSVSPSRLTRDVVDKWLEAAVAAGFKRAEDYNGADQEGVAYFQLTIDGGRRCSSAVAYLKPARGRQNLEVITGAQAEHLLFEDARVCGVRVNLNGTSKDIKARAEVILSAGAIGSPQIMMLSGLGPADHLAEHGIGVRREFKGMGKNLQDHLQARPVYKTDLSTINTETSNIFKQGMIALQYAVSQTGPMTMAASLGAGFLKTDPRLETPDIQFHIQPFSADSPAEGAHKFSAFTASVLQLRPESSGELTLKSANWREHPNIHMNYLATPNDQKTLVKGIQIARKIAAQSPLKEHIIEEHAPGPGVAFDDEDATLDWARNTATTIYHPTGTAKMGQDEMAVVDERLKVRGVPGLRVADASIMPQIVSGNTNAPCIMIGEKCSAMVLEDALV